METSNYFHGFVKQWIGKTKGDDWLLYAKLATAITKIIEKIKMEVLRFFVIISEHYLTNFKPISRSIPPKNARKPEVFWRFQGV